MASQIEHDLIRSLLTAWVNWIHAGELRRRRPAVVDRDLLDAQEEVYFYLHTMRVDPVTPLFVGLAIDCSTGQDRILITADQEGALHYGRGASQYPGWETPQWN